MSPPLAGDAGELRRGTIFAFLAYGIWGLFPLYFHALEPSGAFEILAHRILWTLLFCVVVLVVRRDFGWVASVVHRPKLLGGLTLAALLIAANWVVYVLAVITGRTYAAALGYFLNPIVTVGLGVFVLRERLRPLQWAAVSVGAVAAVYLTVAGGEFPWIAVTLAFSFAFYGLVKKKVGASLDAMHSLTVETLVLAPVAVGVLFWLAAKGSTTFGGHGATHTSLARGRWRRDGDPVAVLCRCCSTHPARDDRSHPVPHADAAAAHRRRAARRARDRRPVGRLRDRLDRLAAVDDRLTAETPRPTAEPASPARTPNPAPEPDPDLICRQTVMMTPGWAGVLIVVATSDCMLGVADYHPEAGAT